MLAEFLFLLPSLFSIAHVSCQTTNLNSTARSAPPTAEVVANFSSSNVGPGGFTPGVPYVTAGSYYRPSGVSDIKYNGGYTLKGNSNLYGIYYGTNNYFDGEHGQAGSPTGDCTVSSSSMYNQSFTGAMDEFLTYFGKSTIPQWKTIMAYTGIGELTFVKSVRISDVSNSKYYITAASSFYGINDTFHDWFGTIISGKIIPDDPVQGIYVVVISESESLRLSSRSPESWVISSAGNTQTNGNFADCSVHSFTPWNNNIYVWAMVQVPLEGSLGSNCFTRIIGAFGMDAATAQTGYSGIVKRQGVMNGIAHELMEIVTDPFAGSGWFVGTDRKNPIENADQCIATFLNSPTTLHCNPVCSNSRCWRANTNINGHWYMVQSAWHPVNQRCE